MTVKLNDTQWKVYSSQLYDPQCRVGIRLEEDVVWFRSEEAKRFAEVILEYVAQQETRDLHDGAVAVLARAGKGPANG
jgi:hypothetical protein